MRESTIHPAAINRAAILLALCASGCDWFDGTDAARGPPRCDNTVACCNYSNYASSQSTPGDAGILPPDPNGPPPDGTGPVVLAISNLYYGDTNRDGSSAADAWKQYGLNIDAKVTGRTSTDICTPALGASRCAMLDGENGIDNSFGENLLPIIVTTFGSSASQQGNAALLAGGPTTLVRFDGLGAGSDYSPLAGLVYHAAPASTPKWDGTDVRDVDMASVVSGSLSSPVLALGGYMNGRTWVGAPPGGTMLVDLHLTAGGHLGPPLPLSHVQIAMLVDPNNGSASGGVLSGILAPDDAVAWAHDMAGWASLCSASAFDSIAQQILQTSDIMMDGTNEPGQACNGISFGMGFDATAVKLGQVVTLPTVVDPCSDGGTEGGDQ